MLCLCLCCVALCCGRFASSIATHGWRQTHTAGSRTLTPVATALGALQTNSVFNVPELLSAVVSHGLQLQPLWVIPTAAVS